MEGGREEGEGTGVFLHQGFGKQQDSVLLMKPSRSSGAAVPLREDAESDSAMDYKGNCPPVSVLCLALCIRQSCLWCLWLTTMLVCVCGEEERGNDVV